MERRTGRKISFDTLQTATEIIRQSGWNFQILKPCVVTCTSLLARGGTRSARLARAMHHPAERRVAGLHILRVAREERVHVAVRIAVCIAGRVGNIVVGPTCLSQSVHDGGDALAAVRRGALLQPLVLLCCVFACAFDHRINTLLWLARGGVACSGHDRLVVVTEMTAARPFAIDPSAKACSFARRASGSVEAPRSIVSTLRVPFPSAYPAVGAMMSSSIPIAARRWITASRPFCASVEPGDPAPSGRCGAGDSPFDAAVATEPERGGDGSGDLARADICCPIATEQRCTDSGH
jgi:hypothetical protein